MRLKQLKCYELLATKVKLKLPTDPRRWFKLKPARRRELSADSGFGWLVHWRPLAEQSKRQKQ